MLRSFVFRIVLSDQKSRRYGVAAESEQAAREIVLDEFESRGETGCSTVDIRPATAQENRVAELFDDRDQASQLMG
jgi:hypothetical protein